MSSEIRDGDRGQNMVRGEQSGWPNRPNSPVRNVMKDSAQTVDIKQEFVNKRYAEKGMPVELIANDLAFNAINKMGEVNGLVGEHKIEIIHTSIDWFKAESLELMLNFGYKIYFLRSEAMTPISQKSELQIRRTDLILRSLYRDFDIIEKHMKQFKCFNSCLKQLDEQAPIKQYDQLVESLIEKELPIKLSTECILVGTHLLANFKIIMFKESTLYYSELDDRSFVVLNSSIEELMFCLDESHQLMITKIDGCVSDYIRQRIQLEIYNTNNGWYDSESEDSSETYIIVLFADSTQIWVRNALILLLYDYNPKFINKIKAQHILNRALRIQP